MKLDNEPGLRIPNMLDAAVEGTFKGIYIQGEDILQSDPDTKHVSAGLAAMECVVVQDLFLNETANYAHVFLPGSTFLEKDGTFTNAERRINRVRKVMAPKNGLADWEVTQKLAQAMGLTWNYTHPSEIMDEIAATTPTFAGVSYDYLEKMGSVQWPCNEKAPRGHADHAHRRLRARQGQVHPHRICADRREDRPALPAAADHRPHPQRSTMSARRRGAPRTSSGTTRTCWRSIRTTPRQRGIRDGDWVRLASRAGETTLRAHDHRPGGAGRRLHDLPPSRHAGQRHHHRLLRLGDQLPGIQGDGGAGVAVQRPERLAAGIRRAGAAEPPHRGPSRGGGVGCDCVRPLTQTTRLARRAAGSTSGNRMVPEETPVAFSFAGTTHAVMMASPADLEDFALGFSLTEGIIDSPDEIEAIEVEDHGAGIDIQIRLKDQANREIPGAPAPARRPGRLRAVRHRVDRGGDALGR